MKKITTAALLGTVLLVSPAFAETTAENEKEIRDNKSAIAKDNASIRSHEQSIDAHRAAKADAKANKQYGKQAKESLAIGGHKAAIAEKKTERSVEQKMLEHDQKERGEYSQRDSDYDYNYSNPSSGYSSYAPRTNFHNDRADGKYPVTTKEGPAAKL